MKPVFMILLASLYGMLAFGQVKVKTTNTVYFLTELKRHNPVLLSVGSGEMLEIDLKSGKYWEAIYKEQLGYIHKHDLKHCVPPDSTMTIRNNSFHVKKKSGQYGCREFKI